MLQGSMSKAWFCFSYCLLLRVCIPAQDVGSQGTQEPGLEDWEWGSGSSLLHLLQNFPADSPFASESSEKSVNCSQRFSLPSSSPICWENIAGPEEFARSRLLVLQNRAALEAVSTSSGVEEGGFSYDHLAKEEVQGIRSDHQDMEETLQTMETVFVSLAEKRKEGNDQGARTSMKEYLATTRNAIDSRTHMANHLEMQFSSLETTLLNVQLRLRKLIRQ